MQAGKLNRRIKLQQRDPARDAAGQPIGEWQDVADLWAQIAGATGLKQITRMQGNVPASTDLYSIRIRFREGVTSGMRVFMGARAFDIRQVRMDFANREWTDLICELGGNEG